ncbi:hypothetical protein L345_17017, partial [Ophiophagus hannah]
MEKPMPQRITSWPFFLQGESVCAHQGIGPEILPGGQHDRSPALPQVRLPVLHEIRALQLPVELANSTHHQEVRRLSHRRGPLKKTHFSEHADPHSRTVCGKRRHWWSFTPFQDLTMVVKQSWLTHFDFACQKVQVLSYIDHQRSLQTVTKRVGPS